MISDTKNNNFLSYDLLNINPQEVFKSKKDQELAVFELSMGISYLLKEKYPSAFQQLCSKFEEICRNLRRK